MSMARQLDTGDTLRESLLDQYATYLRSWQASETTVSARTTLARSRLKAWGLDGFTRENVTAFLALDANGKTRQRWTTATYHSHLSDFCNFLVASGRMDASPMGDIKRSKRPSKKPNPWNDADVDRILSVADGEVRDWILLALLAGLRAFEIAKIRGEDFSPDGIYVMGKGSVEATLPCHPDLAEMATRYGAGYWFPGTHDGHMDSQRISLTVSKFTSSMGIEGSIHRGRHAYGTRLLRKGVNIRVVQRLMRHSSLETTAGYLAVMGDEERDAILLLSA